MGLARDQPHRCQQRITDNAIIFILRAGKITHWRGYLDTTTHRHEYGIRPYPCLKDPRQYCGNRGDNATTSPSLGGEGRHRSGGESY